MGQMCPLERMSRSRSGRSGFLGSWLRMWKYMAVKMSAMPRGPAEWPEPALTSVGMRSSRASLAFSSSCFSLSSNRSAIILNIVLDFWEDCKDLGYTFVILC